jgi:predicted membrane channel-forming protein YqfA (hemolysin III family)
MNAQGVAQWHQTAAWIMIAVNASGGLWALAAQWLPVLRFRPMWIVVIIGQIMAFVLAFTGAILVSRFDRPLDDFHALYGFSAVITVGIVYSYRKSPFMKDNEHLLYGLGCLFLMGLGIRNLYL